MADASDISTSDALEARVRELEQERRHLLATIDIL